LLLSFAKGRGKEHLLVGQLSNEGSGERVGDAVLVMMMVVVMD
jgi:hypothetical protein